MAEVISIRAETTNKIARNCLKYMLGYILTQMRKVNREKGYCIRVRTRAVSVNFFWLENQNKSNNIMTLIRTCIKGGCINESARFLCCCLDFYPSDSAWERKFGMGFEDLCTAYKKISSHNIMRSELIARGYLMRFVSYYLYNWHT